MVTAGEASLTAMAGRIVPSATPSTPEGNPSGGRHNTSTTPSPTRGMRRKWWIDDEAEIWLHLTRRRSPAPSASTTRIAPASFRLIRGQDQHANLPSDAAAGKPAAARRRPSPPGQRQHRRMEIWRGKQRKANHTDVEERRRKGRHREAVPGIEDRPHQRSQEISKNIGKGNTQQLGG